MLKKDTLPMNVPPMLHPDSIRAGDPFEAAAILTFIYLEEARAGKKIRAYKPRKDACAEAMRGMCEF